MTTRRWVPVAVATVALITLFTAGIFGIVRGADAPDGNHAPTARPPVALDLADVTPAIAADYHYAADHADHFAAIPCYCGCDRTAGHRNLADCYISPTGGWDAHASGCAVCGAETTTVRDRLTQGDTIEAVRDLIIDQYGTPPTLYFSGVTS